MRDGVIISFLRVIRKVFRFLFSPVLYVYYRLSSVGGIGLNIISEDETIKKIIDGDLSVVRFGDGEIKWMFGKRGASRFQKPSPELASRLLEVFQRTDDEDVLICLPIALVNPKGLVLKAKFFWLSLLSKYKKQLKRYINKSYMYGDASLTRPYIDFKNKRSRLEKFAQLKKIWEGKKILIVEGQYSRLGVGNDLFDEAKSVRRIICPAEDAFEKYDIIFDKVKEIVKEDEMVLLALGPTATIMAYDLARVGKRSIDIGHIDLEYEWAKMGARKKVPINNRYVNELGWRGAKCSDAQDERYNSEIVTRVGC